MGAPVVLIQWLKPHEYRETRAVIKAFAGKNSQIDLHDIDNKAAFLNSLQVLAQDEDCQFLFIGSHGVKDNGNRPRLQGPVAVSHASGGRRFS